MLEIHVQFNCRLGSRTRRRPTSRSYVLTLQYKWNSSQPTLPNRSHCRSLHGTRYPAGCYGSSQRWSSLLEQQSSTVHHSKRYRPNQRLQPTPITRCTAQKWTQRHVDSHHLRCYPQAVPQTGDLLSISPSPRPCLPSFSILWIRALGFP
jgi:hypothetical protein